MDAETKLKFEEIERRINSLETMVTQLNELVITVKLLAQEQKHISASITDLTSKVEAINMAPAENWNKLKATIITGIISALVSATMGVLITLIASGVIGG